jgi:phage terminase large subunit-like protein
VSAGDLKQFVTFCESLTQSEDRWEGKPLKLEPWQRKFWAEALDGWRSVVLIVARKNGKTQMLAAYALWRLVYGSGRPEILLAAASDRQAGRLFDAAARFVRRHEGLSQVLRVRDHEGVIVREDGLGSIIRLTSDPSRLYGYSPTDVVCDELAFWTTPNLRKAYAALTSGGGARSAPRTFTITTAGEASQRHDSLLGTILDKALDADDVEHKPGLTVARLHDSQTLVYAYEAPTVDPHDVTAMKLANPASWITKDYLRRQAENPELTDAQVLQLHGCVWAATETTWITPGQWAACADRDRELVPGERVVLGFDGSFSRDSTCLLAVALEDFHIWPVAVWQRPDRAPDTWRVPRQEVDDAVTAAFERLDVVELACDPYGWASEIEAWRERFATFSEHTGARQGERVVDFPTASRQRMAPACERFKAAVAEGDLTHDGNPVLAAHVGHCVAKLTPFGHVITKAHPDSPRRIDCAVAAVIGFERAVWHRANPGPAPFDPERAFMWA